MAPRGQPPVSATTSHGSAEASEPRAGPSTHATSHGRQQHTSPAHKSSAGAKAAQTGVFVDAVTGRHASTSATDLLAKRRLTWDKHYGWTYDAWVDDPARYALAGANGRFSLPALARGFTVTVAQAAGATAIFVQTHRHLLRPLQQQLAGLGRAADGEASSLSGA
ncbi:hypothetical protein HXX76_010694 [Chlamydomonas incerta]|uniref:Uncharacterized protein n=1 Tax=Chlamydomonas incerta TaxID=51695 RepID=A0A835VY47_CHLIN|nr:hypothetical protein HXX76_010694 [Chlamydomonas incerta]|eukprot:KAG2429914.1 hypothetical protein HXX76_010694 [Chlamydomonas incerta]